MRIKHKTIILCSIGVVLLLLSTQTTIGVVEKSSIENDLEQAVEQYDRMAIIQILKDIVWERETCDCEVENPDYPVLFCAISYLIFLPIYSIALVFIYLSIICNNDILSGLFEGIGTIFSIVSYAILFFAGECEWVRDYIPLNSLLQQSNDMIPP